MDKRKISVDLVKLSKYLLKYSWLALLCAAVCFGCIYGYSMKNRMDTYTASGTMYVYNANPNLFNYGYTNSQDLKSAVQLLDTYMVVVRSNKVLDVVAERLAKDYPSITPEYIAETISMHSVGETGVVRVSCTACDAQQSADICNAVMDAAPAEIIRVVSAGKIEIIDYAAVPMAPDEFSPVKKSLVGGAAGAAGAIALLTALFLADHKVRDTKELDDRYTLPVLSSILLEKKNGRDPGAFRLNANSPLELTEGYARLRMNLMHALTGKEKRSVIVASAMPDEGKSVIAANLATSLAMSGKRVLLVDADMRRACQGKIFPCDRKAPGLSDILAGRCAWKDTVIRAEPGKLAVLPAGAFPPNPSELMDSSAMHALLPQLEEAYDLVVLDVPPLNIVSDAYALAPCAAGALFAVRQRVSDHREIRKALIQAELGGLELLGFVFCGEKPEQGRKKYYDPSYCNEYDPRKRKNSSMTSERGE